ncbi:EF-hand domain-containing protein [Sphingomonas agri]|uniref:EF-hand domain-containing protein n=1 Tax=Sphingomonas agri TaxID=1813878 RepID=UPI0031201D36
MTRPLYLLVALSLAAPVAAQQQGSAQPKPVSRTAVAAKLDGAFAAADTNHDGFLSVAEVQALENAELQKVQAALRARAAAQFKALDTNKDGQLSFQEFAAATPNVKANDTPAVLLQKWDTNHDGKVSAAEYRAPTLAKFDKVDLNHDGIVTPDEERRAMSQK